MNDAPAEERKTEVVNLNGHTPVPLNLKLQRSLRDGFKKATKTNGLSMQAALSAFARAYTDNPGMFVFKMEVVDQK